LIVGLIVVRQTATGIRARREAWQGRHGLSLASQRSAAHRKGHASRGYAAPRKPNDYRPPVSNPAALLGLALRGLSLRLLRWQRNTCGRPQARFFSLVRFFNF